MNCAASIQLTNDAAQNGQKTHSYFTGTKIVASGPTLARPACGPPGFETPKKKSQSGVSESGWLIRHKVKTSQRNYVRLHCKLIRQSLPRLRAKLLESSRRSGLSRAKRRKAQLDPNRSRSRRNKGPSCCNEFRAKPEGSEQCRPTGRSVGYSCVTKLAEHPPDRSVSIDSSRTGSRQPPHFSIAWHRRKKLLELDVTCHSTGFTGKRATSRAKRLRADHDPAARRPRYSVCPRQEPSQRELSAS
jgi:hypothetical protein